MDSRERNGKHIDQEGNLSFVVTSDGFAEEAYPKVRLHFRDNDESTKT
ncbi:MAG: hypothetical protein Greene041662_363 [Candidatus Peregrinibacteria bacterium Greene0416_62]|nr:MAG: hypothetical protein Greene041662_363 [Candidatus Peregrinibacteria bacterium Greene0416_62]